MPMAAFKSASGFSGLVGASAHPSYWRATSTVGYGVLVGVAPLNVAPRIGMVGWVLPMLPRSRKPPLGRLGLAIRMNDGVPIGELVSQVPLEHSARFSIVATVALCE